MVLSQLAALPDGRCRYSIRTTILFVVKPNGFIKAMIDKGAGHRVDTACCGAAGRLETQQWKGTGWKECERWWARSACLALPASILLP